MTIGAGLVKSWSSTQATVATSSGEAEYYALTKAAAEGLGAQALMLDMGWVVGLQVWVDSTAAKAIASRVGLGKVRHMEVKYLWIQEGLRKKRFTVHKVLGLDNPGDIMTKPHSIRDIENNMSTMGCEVMSESRSIL